MKNIVVYEIALYNAKYGIIGQDSIATIIPTTTDSNPILDTT